MIYIYIYMGKHKQHESPMIAINVIDAVDGQTPAPSEMDEALITEQPTCVSTDAAFRPATVVRWMPYILQVRTTPQMSQF